jgi:sugar phosphate isomerase/epimerase
MDLQMLSTTTYPLIDRPLDEAMAIVADAGFTRIDLLGRKPHFSADPEVVNHDEIKALAEKHGLVISNLATYCGAALQSEDAAAQQAAYDDTLRTIDVAAVLGARSVRGFRSPKFDDADNIPRMVPWMKRLCEYAGEKGIALSLENHGGGISGNPDACRKLFDAVDSRWFGVLYDPCNLLTGGADYRAGLETMKDHVAGVHIKDGTPEKESQKRTMLGEGDVDVRWILDRLDAIGYDGDVTLEYECEVEPPDTGLKKWYDYMASLVA